MTTDGDSESEIESNILSIYEDRSESTDSSIEDLSEENDL